MSTLSPNVDLWTVPCGPPPEGVTPDFHKKSPLMGLTIAIVVVVSSLMVLTMTLRFWTKYRSHESWKSDDCALQLPIFPRRANKLIHGSVFTIATFAFTITQGVMQVFQTKKLGFEAWDIPLGFLLSLWPRRVRAPPETMGACANCRDRC
jgi:ABC-type uncharacterized transport system permease subunit